MPGKHAIRSAFEQAADTYHRASLLQREICDRLALLANQWPPPDSPARILDAGSGTGHGLTILSRLHPNADCISLDLAPAMLETLRYKHLHGTIPPCVVAGDIECLPLKNGCCAAIWSSLALQWCDPARALAEFSRVCSPGGVIWLSTLGPRTFHELRAAFATLDTAEHTIVFHAPAMWQEHARAAGLEILAYQREQHSARAGTLRELLHGIKAIGAHTLTARKRTLMGRGAWSKLVNHYERYRLADGQLPATYDVILLALHKPS